MFMKDTRAAIGRSGEDIAVDFLKRQGYRILTRNFRIRRGEVDIIAQDGDTFCFIEVKRRTTMHKGSPLEAISRLKKRKLTYVALSYLKSQHLEHRNARFDVVSVYGDDDSAKVQIIKNAFDVESYCF